MQSGEMRQVYHSLNIVYHGLITLILTKTVEYRSLYESQQEDHDDVDYHSFSEAIISLMRFLFTRCGIELSNVEIDSIFNLFVFESPHVAADSTMVF